MNFHLSSSNKESRYLGSSHLTPYLLPFCARAHSCRKRRDRTICAERGRRCLICYVWIYADELLFLFHAVRVNVDTCVHFPPFARGFPSSRGSRGTRLGAERPPPIPRQWTRPRSAMLDGAGSQLSSARTSQESFYALASSPSRRSFALKPWRFSRVGTSR